MEQNKTDLVMKFILQGSAVLAESNLDIMKGDPLMLDFKTGLNYDYYSEFFEVSSFEMGLSLKEDDESKSSLNPHAKVGTEKKTSAVGQFPAWRSATGDEFKTIKFRPQVDRFTFKRVIDSASPIFFEACCTSRSFDSAVLVKRISQGDQAGAAPSVGYLRIAFTKVLIVGVSWDDGDVVTEQCEFICQDLDISYRQQGPKGDFGGIMMAHWPKDLTLKSSGGRTH